MYLELETARVSEKPATAKARSPHTGNCVPDHAARWPGPAGFSGTSSKQTGWTKGTVERALYSQDVGPGSAQKRLAGFCAGTHGFQVELLQCCS